MVMISPRSRSSAVARLVADYNANPVSRSVGPGGGPPGAA